MQAHFLDAVLASLIIWRRACFSKRRISRGVSPSVPSSICSCTVFCGSSKPHSQSGYSESSLYVGCSASFSRSTGTCVVRSNFSTGTAAAPPPLPPAPEKSKEQWANLAERAHTSITECRAPYLSSSSAAQVLKLAALNEQLLTGAKTAPLRLSGSPTSLDGLLLATRRS